MQAFAAADVDDIRIRFGDSDIADGAGRLLIEDRLPRVAIIVGLPDAAVVDADIENIGLARNADGADSTASTERADTAPAHALIEIGIELLHRCQKRQHGEQE